MWRLNEPKLKSCDMERLLFEANKYCGKRKIIVKAIGLVVAGLPSSLFFLYFSFFLFDKESYFFTIMIGAFLAICFWHIILCALYNYFIKIKYINNEMAELILRREI